MGTRAINYPFAESANYTNPATIEVSSGKAKLVLQNNPGQDFTETFDSDTGFTYDNTKAEFTSGLVRQINKRPTDAIFYASYTTDEDANWGEGTLTGTLGGSASVSGGELDLTGGNANCEYNPDNLTTMLQTGCIRIRWKPNYTGNAPAVQELFQSNASTANRVHMRHNSNFIQCYGYNSAGVLIFNLSFVWTPTSIKYYEIELNFDYTGGNARVFIDGQLKDSDTGTGTRTNNNLFRLGASGGMNSYITDVLVFDTVQHTSNYSPDWSDIFEYDYLASNVILPEMEYTGAGTLISFDAFTTVEGGSPRYTLQIGRSGNYLYWNGSAWVTSDGTYAQANDYATFAVNVGSLAITGEIYGQFKIHFGDSNSQGNVGELTASLTAQIYSTADPTISPNTLFTGDQLLSYNMTATITGSDGIGHILAKDGIDYYYNTVNEEWTTSDGTYAQSNTAAEVEANKTTFLTEGLGAEITSKWILHSDSGLTTPELDLIAITYDFYAEAISDASVCSVYGWVRSGNIPISGAVITISPSKQVSLYNNEGMEILQDYQLTTNSNGYWEQDLIVSVNLDIRFNVTVHYQNDDGSVYHRQYNNIIIPNQASINFAELV